MLADFISLVRLVVFENQKKFSLKQEKMSASGGFIGFFFGEVGKEKIGGFGEEIGCFGEEEFARCERIINRKIQYKILPYPLDTERLDEKIINTPKLLRREIGRMIRMVGGADSKVPPGCVTRMVDYPLCLDYLKMGNYDATLAGYLIRHYFRVIVSFFLFTVKLFLTGISDRPIRSELMTSNLTGISDRPIRSELMTSNLTESDFYF